MQCGSMALALAVSWASAAETFDVSASNEIDSKERMTTRMSAQPPKQYPTISILAVMPVAEAPTTLPMPTSEEAVRLPWSGGGA
jgi:hypothetical protein